MSEMGFAPHDDQHRGGPGLLSFMLNVMGLGGNPRAVNPDNVTNRGSSYEVDTHQFACPISRGFTRKDEFLIQICKCVKA